MFNIPVAVINNKKFVSSSTDIRMSPAHGEKVAQRSYG
jgi:hypothetical protein